MNMEILLLLFPVIAAFVIPAGSAVKKTFGRLPALLAFLAGFVYAAWLLPGVMEAPRVVITANWRPPFGINFLISPLSLGAVMMIYAAGFLSVLFDLQNTEKKKGQYYLLYSLVITASIGMVLTADLFNLFVFLEIAGIASFALVAAGSGNTGTASGAGLKYLIQAQIAGLLMLGGIALVYSASGVLNMGSLSSFAAFNPAFAFLAGVLILLPVLLETKLFPFNTWVGGAYSSASPSFAGTLSSVTAFAGAVVMGRLVLGMMGGASAFAPAAGKIRLLLLVLGVITVLYGEIAAFREANLKKMLGYSSIGQMGMVIIGFIIADAGAVTGALLLLASHSAAKLLLFFVTGFLVSKTGTPDRHALKGAGRAYPFVGALFIVGALTIMGIPLFSGFWGKLDVLKGAAAAGGPALAGFFAILAGTVFEGVYFLRAGHTLFLEGERKFEGKPNFTLVLTGIILAAAVITAGLFPQLIRPWLESAAKDLLSSDYGNIILQAGGAL